VVSQSITLRLLEKPRSDQRMFLSEDDFGDDLNFTIQDKDGNAKNLTGIMPKFQVWSKGLAPFLDEDATIVSAVAGTCKYNVKETDFNGRTGVFYAKLVLKTGTTKKESTEKFLLVLQE